MQIGEQISILRKQNNMSRVSLAAGICSPQALTNIEEGISIPDKLLVDVLLQRLGKSPDRLEMILTAETYHMEKMRALYEELLERGKGKKAIYLLEKYREKFPQNDALQQMYYCRSKAYLEYRLRNNPVKAEELLKETLDISLPGWENTSFDKYRISSIELENILAYSRMQLVQLSAEAKEESIHLQQVFSLLKRCEDYIQQYVTDGEEHAKIFPKCAWLLAHCYSMSGKSEAAVEVCQEAFCELQENGILYFMLPMLDVLIEQGEDYMPAQKYKVYGNYRRILRELLMEYDEAWHFEDSLFRNCCQKMYHLDYEYIRGERLAQGYTQEELIEGIYGAPESLSRVECGKVSPSGKKFTKLMGKLHIDKERYNGFVITESYEMLEVQQQVAVLMGHREYDKAAQLLNKLEERLDLSERVNARVVQYYKNVIARQGKEAQIEEVLQSNIELLQQTYRVEESRTFRAPDWAEAYLLNQIAILYGQMGQKDKALSVYQLALQALESSNMEPRYRYRTYILLAYNYASEICSEEYTKQNIKFELSCGKMAALGQNHVVWICVLLRRGNNQKLCKKLLVDNYYLQLLADRKENIELIKRFYEQHIKEPFVLE